MSFFYQIFHVGTQLVLQNIISTGIITFTCMVTLAAYYSSKNKQKYWERKGIKGPKPTPFIGNFWDLFIGDRVKHELEWVKKYGKVYGIYEGNTPRLVVADPEIMLQICIKDFETFPNHDENEFAHRYFKSFLIFIRNEQWKRTRALMSPTFTSGKIKRMFRFLDGCADDLVQCVADQLPIDKTKQEQVANVNVKDLYSLFTMDAIATCCYGLKLERTGAADLKTAATRNDFVASAMKIFEFSIPRILIAVATPKPILRFFDFRFNPDCYLDPLASRVQKLINQRRGSQKKFDDYLQLLIDAKLDDQLELNEMDIAENHHAALTHESILKDQKQLISDISEGEGDRATLTDFEILANAMFLMAVGLETTGTLLAHCTYALAFHPEIQEQLYEEVMKISEYDEEKKRLKFDYESLTSCKYLDAVLSEALRMMSPVVSLDRQSNKEYHLKKYDVVLPKDALINLSYYAILNDPDYWPNPDRFDPERFMPENKDKIVPGSYCPFGLGPRHCLGMRFSLTEAKLALAKMLVSYRFEPAPGTKFPCESKRTLALNNIKTPFVSVKPRI